MYYLLTSPAYAHICNLLSYVSVRSMAAFLCALTLTLTFGSWFIKTSQKRFRVKVSNRPPKRHLEKDDTPTMGGLFILAIFTINTLLLNNLFQPKIWIFLFCLSSFGLIGFIDDFAKIKRVNGISARLKMVLQMICSGITMTAWYVFDSPNTQLCIPFFKNTMPEMGVWVIPWGMFILIACSNAVNLTDGLDGLAAGPLIFNFTAFSIIAYLAGHQFYASYLHIPFAQTAELSIAGATLIGALLGFLWFNTYPAQIFMGDVGALSLGAGLALMTIFCRQELLLPLAGGIFVLETASVIIQVLSFKILGRRIFRMAPIHHHFELLGWNESKITIRFWIISLILSVLTLLTLKIR